MQRRTPLEESLIGCIKSSFSHTRHQLPTSPQHSGQCTTASLPNQPHTSMSYPLSNLYAPPPPPYHPSHPPRTLPYIMMDFDELLYYPLNPPPAPWDLSAFLSAAHHRLTYWRSAITYIWQGGAANVLLEWEQGLGTVIQTIQRALDQLQEKVTEAEELRIRQAPVVDSSSFADVIAARERAQTSRSSTTASTATRSSRRRSGGHRSSRR